MNKKVLVFGGKGKIGKVLVDKLVELGYLVESYSRTDGGDIRDVDKVNKVISRNDLIVHLTAKQGLSKDWNEFWGINVDGTKNVLEACIRFKKRLIYVSTIMVFKDTKNILADENWSIRERKSGNYYVDSKVEALKLVKKYQKKLDMVIVYPTIVLDKKSVKDGQKPGRWMSLIGDKNRIINIVWMDDLVDGLIKLIKLEKKGDYILGGFNITVDDYLELLKVSKWPRVPYWLIILLNKFVLLLPGILKEIVRSPLDSMNFSSIKAKKELKYKVSRVNNIW
jgi:nucleoside-diphosphate-sugar epimerase